MALRARNASPWPSTLTPQSTDLGLGPDLRCGVRAGSLRALEPRARAETRGRKRKNADVQRKQTCLKQYKVPLRDVYDVKSQG